MKNLSHQPPLNELGQLVAAVTDELFAATEPVHARTKADGSVVTDLDEALQLRISQALGARWPEYTLLGEEMGSETQSRLLADRGTGLWVLDPLDGTSNFTAGLPIYGVSLALIDAAGPARAVVYDPVRRECFSAGRGEGAFLNGERLQRSDRRIALPEAVAIVDFKRLPAELATRLATRPPYRSQRNFGSVALEWCWLAAGRGDIYLHGGQKLWDYAAGHLIFFETGGAACGMDGKPVFRPSLAPRAVIAARDADLLAAWRLSLDQPVW